MKQFCSIIIAVAIGVVLGGLLLQWLREKLANLANAKLVEVKMASRGPIGFASVTPATIP